MSLKSEIAISDGSVKPYIEINKKHIEAIVHEYWEAQRKHLDFCKTMIDDECGFSWEQSGYAIKNRNAKNGNGYADDVLLEEVAEAFNAYSKGELYNALQEFAQCGAVILRCMQYVENEINKGKK